MELVQNADDAGASEVALMLDFESYPTDKLLGEQLLRLNSEAFKTRTAGMFLADDLLAGTDRIHGDCWACLSS